MFQKDGLINTNLSSHSPHQIIPTRIIPNTTILDVGCNTGMLGKILNKKNILDGIDINPKALKKAKKYYRNLYRFDLSTPFNLKLKHKYDYIVFSDLLEHLPRPDLLLIKIKKYLKNNGVIICSLPNIARFEIRLNLLMGKFNYSNSGILNEDHLRFFTKETSIRLFVDCGYTVTKITPTGLGHSLGILENLTAFQFIYEAKIAI